MFQGVLHPVGLDSKLRSSPVVWWTGVVQECEEEVLSTELLGARFTFTIESEQLTLTVDEEFAVDGVLEPQAARSHS